MNKEQLIAMGLTEEQATQVLEGFKGYIPSSRFNEVNEAKKNAEALVAERDKQLAELKQAVGDNDSLKQQIEKLQLDNTKAQERYAATMKQLKVDGAVEVALASKGALSVKAAKALLDMSKITIEGDEIKGVTEQVEQLIKEQAFLFKETKPKGMNPGEGKNKQEPKPYDKMTYSERLAYLAAQGK